jgi:glutamine synthetase
MRDLETSGHRLGIPIKTRHNEVAPNQFELAPIYGETNLANDQNQLLMNLMNQIARKHGFVVLLHEKPFDGINGSGKHNNWSLSTDNGVLLHAPGKTPEQNLRFATFIVETLMGVWRHNGLLKASIMSATNAHRLGANEAPPAIISSFLGKQVSELLDHIEKADVSDILAMAGKQGMKMDIPEIPELFIDNTDRNRTSPFAFTGNRFEFRAVGSCANCAGAMTTLNAAVAEQLIAFKEEVEKEIAKGKKTPVAIMDALKPIIKSVIDTICFDGNGYTEEWKKEAERRGLDTETNVPKMFCQFTKPASVEMFTKTGVYSEKELAARNDVKWETYVKKVQIESRVMVRMALNHIVPAALEYKGKLLKEVIMAKEIYGNLDNCTTELRILDDINKYVEAVRVKATAMKEARKKANVIEDTYERALAYHEIAESLYDLRKPIDKLEEVVDNKMWPLPKYRELLFIS